MSYEGKYKNDFEKYDSKDVVLIKEIILTLKKLGITDNLDGFEYLKEAVYLASKDPSMLMNVTKELYPELGHKYKKTPDSIEHSMRYAIDKSWRTGEVDFIYEKFSFPVKRAVKPSASLFVKKLSTEMRLQFEID